MLQSRSTYSRQLGSRASPTATQSSLYSMMHLEAIGCTPNDETSQQFTVYHPRRPQNGCGAAFRLRLSCAFQASDDTSNGGEVVGGPAQSNEPIHACSLRFVQVRRTRSKRSLHHPFDLASYARVHVLFDANQTVACTLALVSALVLDQFCIPCVVE